VAALWLNAEPLLLAMGQPPPIVQLTCTFLKWRLPGMPFLCVSESVGSFLKAQRIMVRGPIFKDRFTL
jgi:Na+-driven multidrug efflux pump